MPLVGRYDGVVEYFLGANRVFIRAALVCAALLSLAVVGAFAADTKRVLLVHAFGHAYSPWSDMAGSFRAELIGKSSGSIDLYEVSLDTERVRAQREKGRLSTISARYLEDANLI